MTRILRLSTLGTVLALSCATAAPAQTVDMAEQTCAATAVLASEAQALRIAGDSERRATNKMRRTHRDLGPAYTEQVIPVLINYVYMQPEDVLDQDLGAYWKEQC